MEIKSKAANVVQRDFADSDVVSFLRDVAQAAKRHGVRSALVMTVDIHGHASWEDFIDGEYDAAIMALAMEDCRMDLKALVFGEVSE